MSQSTPADQLDPQQALALLKLYIEWGADEAIEPTPQSRLAATGRPAGPATPAAAPAGRQLSEQAATPFRAPPPAPARVQRLMPGPMDQAAVLSAREAARA
ncbi:MAG TPA: hypothetical protein VFS85_04855, partial [Dongiaceae bacterium]|nr:hypothetical protein [Dongiaceae bacterium]